MGASAIAVRKGKTADLRFEFGKNWTRFLKTVDDARVADAENCLKCSLHLDDLAGMSFLDIGSGSGLFSLAARRLGATVHSFDYDLDSVACTRILKEKFHADNDSWRIERGSALDESYVRALGLFDIVYSWGVLHHTGDLYRALDVARLPVKPGGRLLVAIYNDQGAVSKRWAYLKRAHARSPRVVKFAIELTTFVVTWLRCVPLDIVRLKPFRTVNAWRSYSRVRGMSPWHDVVDWAGGFPFEVAPPEAIFRFFRDRGFRLEDLKTCGGGKGCNEFLFLREV